MLLSVKHQVRFVHIDAFKKNYKLRCLPNGVGHSHVLCPKLVRYSFPKRFANGNKSDTTNRFDPSFYLREILKGRDESFEVLKGLFLDAIKTERDQGDFVPDAVTQLLCKIYSKLDRNGKRRYLQILSQVLGVDQTQIFKVAQHLLNIKDKDEATISKVLKQLKSTLTPLYEKLFDQVNAQPNGMKFLIDVRKDLLEILEGPDRHSIYLRTLNDDLKKMLQQWFSIGFLKIQRIDWDSPARLLEKMKEYSTAVHPIKSWDELRDRLGHGKRCFAFFHPSLPEELLVVIEIALTTEISSSIAPLLRPSEIEEEVATTAIFYSITSTQPGLQGVELGHLLIKQVITLLQKEFPQIKTFCTLSPIPTFRSWLESKIALELHEQSKFATMSLLTPTEVDLFIKLNPSAHPCATFARLLETAWWNEPSTAELLRAPLMRLCAHFLLKEKKRGLAFDPVCNFHLRNGAQIYRLNWLADTSEKRLAQSYGIMVNYLYDLSDIRKNNEAYLLKGQISSSELVNNML